MDNNFAKRLKKRLISDLRVELSEEFDRNFERKAFFSKRWKPRRYHNPKGTLLMVTGKLRRSIQSHETDHGVRFTSQVPYASIHNEGGKGTKPVRAHNRRTPKGNITTVRAHSRSFNMPQRQFIGDSPETRRIIGDVIEDNVKALDKEIAKALRR